MLVFLSLVAILACYFRRPLKKFATKKHYNRMALSGSPEPILPYKRSSFFATPAPAMTEVKSYSARSSKVYGIPLPVSPAPAMPPPAYVRRSGSNDRKTYATFATETSTDSDNVTNYSSPSPQLAPRVKRRLSDRFPIAMPIPQAVSAPVAAVLTPTPMTDASPPTPTSPTKTPTSFQFQLPEILSSPAFDSSHDSWPLSVSETPQSAVGAGPRSAHKSWASSQSKRLERQERLQELVREAEILALQGQVDGNTVGGERASGMSAAEETPRAFKQHPGMRVSFGVKQGRIMSAELDKHMMMQGGGRV